MMDWTDRHCRAFHRLLSRAGAALYRDGDGAGGGPGGRGLLGFDPAEHPVALQLGGSDPANWRRPRIGREAGYDEINLNVRLPVGPGAVGLFRGGADGTPALVADCVAAMIAAAPMSR
jgi:tRNA-dihydrouridine synthase A